MRVRLTTVVIVVLAAFVFLLGGCAGSGTLDAEHTAPGIARKKNFGLARAAAQELKRPSARAQAAPPPDRLSGLTLPASGDAVPAEAELSLASVMELERFADSVVPDSTETDQQAQPEDEEARAEALRSYVLGRAARLADDLTHADEEIRRAAKLDPSSPVIWLEFAEIQLRLGNRPLAASGFRRALSGDPSNVRALEFLSGDAIERRESERAVSLLLHLRRLHPAQYDPALPAIVAARLGSALIDLGYLEAGIEALGPALELPDRFGHSTNYSTELTSIYRRRGSLWIETGDALAQLNRIDEAKSAYERSEQMARGDSTDVLTRLTYMDMRAGHPAHAAARVLEQARSAPESLGSDTLDLLRYVVQHSALGSAVAEEIGQLRSDLGDATGPGIERALTIAAATVADDDDALTLLATYLTTRPTDDSALRRFVVRAAAMGENVLAKHVIELVHSDPLQLERFTRAMVSDGRDPEQLAKVIEGLKLDVHQRASASLLRVRLLAMAGDLDHAQKLAEEIITNDTGISRAWAAGLDGWLLRQLQRYDDAVAMAEQLLAEDDPESQLAGVLVLSRIDEEPRALDRLRPLVKSNHAPWSEAVTEDVRLLMAQLHIAVEQYDEAAEIFQRVLAHDPARGDALRGLLVLHGAGQGKIDDATIRSVLEAARAFDADAVPLRLLRAQEQMARRQYDRAQRELLEIDNAMPGQESVLRLLVQLRLRLNETQETQDQLRASIERFPGEPLYARMLAETYVSKRLNKDAIDVLETSLAIQPGNVDISTRLEALLRAQGNAQRADELLEARLAQGPRTPRVVFDLARAARAQGKIPEFASLAIEMFDMARPAPKEAIPWIEEELNTLYLASTRNGVQPKLVLQIQQAYVRDVPIASFRAHLIGVQLLVQTKADVEDVIAAAQAGSMAAKDAAWQLFFQPGASWLDQRMTTIEDQLVKAQDAAKIAKIGAQQLGQNSGRLPFLWAFAGVQLAELGQQWAPLEEALQFSRDNGMYEQMLREWAVLLNGGRVAQGMTLLADAAVRMADALNGSNNMALTEFLFRDALKRDPDNLNANNNFGYQMLVAGVNLDEAVGLVEHAYELAKKVFPDPARRAFVTDSLGWARYKTGVLFDVPGDDGQPIVEGAIRVLKRAVDRARISAQQDPRQAPVVPVVLDHLGDALWAAGERDRALVVWTKSFTEAEKLMKELGTKADETTTGGLTEMLGAAKTAHEKVDAAKEDRAPSISPVLRPINQPAAAAVEPDPVQ